MYRTLLTLHILGAAVWTGGHLVLALAILPGVLRERSVSALLAFESRFERIGIPALIVQVATGLWLASYWLASPSEALTGATAAGTLVGLKLLLLLTTAAFAVHARLRLIPRLTPETLPALAWHIVPVTILSVLFVIVGVGFRTGGAG